MGTINLRRSPVIVFAFIGSIIFILSLSFNNLPPISIEPIDVNIHTQNVPAVYNIQRDSTVFQSWSENINISRWLLSNERLREENLALPACPPGTRLNGDDPVVEKLSQCAGDNWKMIFPPTLEAWRYSKNSVCGDQFVTFHRDAALLQNVLLDPTRSKARNCSDSLDQQDNLQPTEGFFQLVSNRKCDRISKYHFIGGESNHLTQWAAATIHIPWFQAEVPSSQRFTIAVQRYEFLNIYHALSDIYNAFLATSFFNIPPSVVDVIFVDSKPRGYLFQTWSKLFHSVTALCDIRDLKSYKVMFWNKLGHDSDLLVYSNQNLPLVEEFRTFVLKSYNLQIQKSDLPTRCQQTLSVQMIVRENYINRNISRQISNADDIVDAIHRNLTLKMKVQLVRLEQLSMEEQLRLISDTDVLIGMHGAGLSHALFLPSHSGVLELLPKYFKLASGHFRGIASWRNLKYFRWENQEDVNELKPGVSTRVPPSVVTDLLLQMRKAMCEAK